MRILHLVHQYLPDSVGGTELYTQSLARQQVAQGHAVAIFTVSSATGAAPRTEATVENGVRIYRFPAGNRSRGRVFLDTFSQKQMSRVFANAILHETPDVIHVQHLMGLPFKIIDLVAASAVPFVITLHDYWYVCANAQLITNHDRTLCDGPDVKSQNCGRCALARAGIPSPGWLSSVAAPVMAFRNRRLKQVFDAADRIIAPTDFVRQTYLRTGTIQHKIAVIPHGIEVPPEGQSIGERGRRDRSLDKLRIGYLGSLGWQKGVHVLIDATNRLPREGVQLAIFGSTSTFPDYFDSLIKSVAHEGIRFAGQVSRDRVWEVLADLDVLVLPTLWYEASPLTIQEAFAAGVPVVASRIGALTEKVRDGVDGLLVTPGDAEALYQALLRLMTDPKLLESLKAGIRPVFTIEEHARQVEAAYPSRE